MINKMIIKKQTTSIDFLIPLIKRYNEGGKVSTPKECTSADNDFGNLILKFLWIRDQAHLFHWQTKFNAEHVNLGDFYEDYLEELDELAESIFGKRGSTFTIGKGIINFVDYSKENLKMYLDRIASVFTKDFPQYFPESKENVGLYHKIGDILELISKLKYLLSQK